MLSPNYDAIPSESTIEQMSNHLLLTVLDNPTAWIFVPTRNDEREKAYDASLQGTKSLIVQYKRIQRRAGWWITIDINARQFASLLNNFPKLGTPYVFFAFSLSGSYKEIRDDHLVGRGNLALEKTIFVDAHTLPMSTTNLRCGFLQRRPVMAIQARHGRNILASIHGYFTGFDLIHHMKGCEVGLVGGLEFGSTDDDLRANLRLNIIRYQL